MEEMMNRFIYSALIFVSIFTFSGCSDFFDANPDDILLGEDYIADINEFYSGYMGVAAKVQTVAHKAVILSELRGDLLEPTVNAPQYLWEIYNYSNDNNNEYTNPSGFYDIVVNANDYLKNAVEYKRENPNAISDVDFNGFISATIRYKVWAYLMIGKLYGEAIYFDDPMVEYQPDHNYPTLEFDLLIDQLIVLMDEGISVPNVIDGALVEVAVNGMLPFYFSQLIARDGSPDDSWDMINPEAECLKIELDLWDENYDAVIDEAWEFLYAEGSTKKFKITYDEYNNEWFVDIFSGLSRGLLTAERINMIVYNYDNGQVNDLLNFFSNQAPNQYYLRPTQVAMDRFNNQYQENGVDKGDLYRGMGRSFDMVDGQWVYRKLTHYFEESQERVYKTLDNIYMYRASDIHFFLIEALNQKNLFKEAEALLNKGLVNDYYTKFARGDHKYPFTKYQDAWADNVGIRERVNCVPVYPSADSIAEPELYKFQLDSLILEETCLESNGEGRSYFAMIRMAKRWGDPSILADKVSAKFTEGKKEEVRAYLLEPKNWYIKYELSNK